MLPSEMNNIIKLLKVEQQNKWKIKFKEQIAAGDNQYRSHHQ